ncbi:MAG: hypothetical protein Q8K36_05595 [Alphaproteobacteria bacterium]|nr:hypothetical protein [Alphaproteobacteria bacterium]
MQRDPKAMMQAATFCKLSIRQMMDKFLIVPLVCLMVVFVSQLLSIHHIHAPEQILGLIALLPPLFLVQEVSHSTQDDIKDGVLEHLLGNGMTITTYMFLKIACFTCVLIVPYLLTVWVVLYTTALNGILFIILDLFLLCLSFVSLSCVLGLSGIHTPYFGMLLLPFHLPYYILLIGNTSHGFDIMTHIMMLGMTLVSLSLGFILSLVLRNTIF